MSHQIVITRDKEGSLHVKEMSAGEVTRDADGNVIRETRGGVDRTHEFKAGVGPEPVVRYVREALSELVAPQGGGR